MDPDVNMPAVSPLENFPAEIWSKIISFLPLHDRCRLECVSQQLSEFAKASWDQLQLKKLRISPVFTNSAAKLATLLRRCGPYLEEIVIGRHIQLDSEAQLFQLCPNVKVLSFTDGKSLTLAKHKSLPEAELNQKARRFLESMPKLERLQLFSSIDYSQGGPSVVVTLRGIVYGFLNMPNVQELHLPFTWIDGPSVRYMEALQHIRILSVMVPEKLVFTDSTPNSVPFMWVSREGNQIEYPLDLIVTTICQLPLLEQLYIRLSPPLTRFFNVAIVDKLAESLPNLNSLVLRFGCDSRGVAYIPVGCIDAIIGQFVQLRTLVIVCRDQRLEGNSDGPVPVDLSEHHDRQVPLNIFVVHHNLPEVPFHSNFTGYSPQINLISVPNRRRGQAIEFLSSYRQNDFHFADQKCLEMVKMSSHFNGEWDFSY